MNKYLMATIFLVLILLLEISSLFSFSIFTNEGGYPRKYFTTNIPFIYRLNNSTPPEYVPSIDAGAQVWEDVISSFWEFTNGGYTAANSVNYDGINLIFFDIEGINFTPGTNVIAFSSTWTTGSGANYRAVESDLIWNARDFPPSLTGEPGKQDLQSVIAHELGHHLGLGHAGPAGGPPGVGPLITAATMYGYSSDGDTTKRSLHIDDIAGVSTIYPVWVLQGNITDAQSGLPFPEVALSSPVVFAAEIGPPEYGNNVYQRPGYYRDTVTVDTSGFYQVVCLKQNFELTAVYFGYENEQATVAFNNPGGIGQTQILTLNFQMSQSPPATISGTVIDSALGLPVAAQIKVKAVSQKPGVPSGFIVDTTTTSSGDFSFELLSNEDYEITFLPDPPYITRTILIENLPSSGTNLSVYLHRASVLLVNDDNSTQFESYFTSTLGQTEQTYYLWRIAEKGIPDASIFSQFPDPCTVIWFTGNANDSVLTYDEQLQLCHLLNRGGRLLLTGQNIVEKSVEDTLLVDYLGVSFQSNIATPLATGVANDPIGNGLLISTVGGAGNQTSRDVLNVTGNAIPIIMYGTTTPLGVAGVRVEQPAANWKAVFLGFGLEGVNNSLGIRDTLLSRIFQWFSAVTGFNEFTDQNTSPLNTFYLEKNYPNPFNSQTVISYQLPTQAEVRLEVYNILGQKIRTLLDQSQPAGSYHLIWDGKDQNGIEMTSGLYFYRIQTGSFTTVRKMLLVK